MSSESRPSKKQRELLTYITSFIRVNGYGPSYREVMNALHYKSVSTVATHIDNLIVKGHLRKREHSARSLEVVEANETFTPQKVTASQEKWLVDLVGHHFTAAEKQVTQKHIDNAYVLVGALQVLGLEDAARSFKARLLALRGQSE